MDKKVYINKTDMEPSFDQNDDAPMWSPVKKKVVVGFIGAATIGTAVITQNMGAVAVGIPLTLAVMALPCNKKQE